MMRVTSGGGVHLGGGGADLLSVVTGPALSTWPGGGAISLGADESRGGASSRLAGGGRAVAAAALGPASLLRLGGGAFTVVRDTPGGGVFGGALCVGGAVLASPTRPPSSLSPAGGTAGQRSCGGQSCCASWCASMFPDGVREGTLSPVEAKWALMAAARGSPPDCHVKAAARIRLSDGFPNGCAIFVCARRFLPSLRSATI